MKFDCAYALFVLCLIMHFVSADLNRCFQLKELSPDQKTGVLLLSDFVLSDFYNRSGDCRRVVHADSFKLNGVCNNIDIHVDNPVELETCRNDHPDFKSEGFTRCRWNERNVLSQTFVTIGESHSETVDIELYDRARCEDFMLKGKISVGPQAGPNSISRCLKANFDSESSMLKLELISLSNVLSQFHQGKGICKNFVRIRSAFVDNICHEVSFYNGGRTQKIYCKKHQGRSNRSEFKRCVWTKRTVFSTISIPSKRAQTGNEVNIQLFSGRHCSGKIVSGSLVVT